MTCDPPASRTPPLTLGVFRAAGRDSGYVNAQRTAMNTANCLSTARSGLYCQARCHYPAALSGAVVGDDPCTVDPSGPTVTHPSTKGPGMHGQGRHRGLPRVGAPRRRADSRPRRPSAALAVVLGMVALGMVALAGCSSGHGAAAGSGAPTTAPAVILKAAALPHKVANEPSLRKNVTQTSCAAIPGGWSAGGTAQNPGPHAVTYKITVYFTTEHATTLNFAVATVHVPAGQSSAWVAQKKFKAQPQMLCPMPGIARAG